MLFLISSSFFFLIFGWNRMPTKTNKHFIFPTKYCRVHYTLVWFEKINPTLAAAQMATDVILLGYSFEPPSLSGTKSHAGLKLVCKSWRLGVKFSLSFVDKGYRRLVLLCSTDIWIDIKHGNSGGGLPSWRHRKAARGEQDRGAAGRSGQLVPGALSDLPARKFYPHTHKI